MESKINTMYLKRYVKVETNIEKIRIMTLCDTRTTLNLIVKTMKVNMSLKVSNHSKYMYVVLFLEGLLNSLDK